MDTKHSLASFSGAGLGELARLRHGRCGIGGLLLLRASGVGRQRLSEVRRRSRAIARGVPRRSMVIGDAAWCGGFRWCVRFTVFKLLFLQVSLTSFTGDGHRKAKLIRR